MPTELNCDRIHPTNPFICTIDVGTCRISTSTTAIATVPAGKTAVISVKVKNSAGKDSTPAEKEIIAPAARKFTLAILMLGVGPSYEQSLLLN